MVEFSTEKKYKLGLALSGGGAKGFAHLGVIKALEEHGIKPDVISGVSAGAIVGALYSDGKSVEEIMKFFREAEFFNFAKFIIPKSSLMSIDRFKNRLDKELKAKTFEELNIPLYINASNLNHGHNTIFSSGKLLDKIIASVSVPIYFPPTEIENEQFLDGGIFCNFPISSIRNISEKIIGVHLNPIVDNENVSGIIDIAERVYHFLFQSNVIREKPFCDILIEPPGLRNYGMFDLAKCDEIYEVGYKEATRILGNMNLSELV